MFCPRVVAVDTSDPIPPAVSGGLTTQGAIHSTGAVGGDLVLLTKSLARLTQEVSDLATVIADTVRERAKVE